MKNELTPLQAEILGVCEGHVAEKGYFPSLRQLAELMGFQSTNAVRQPLLALVKKRRLERYAEGARQKWRLPANKKAENRIAELEAELIAARERASDLGEIARNLHSMMLNAHEAGCRNRDPDQMLRILLDGVNLGWKIRALLEGAKP